MRIKLESDENMKLTYEFEVEYKAAEQHVASNPHVTTSTAFIPSSQQTRSQRTRNTFARCALSRVPTRVLGRTGQNRLCARRGASLTPQDPRPVPIDRWALTNPTPSRERGLPVVLINFACKVF